MVSVAKVKDGPVKKGSSTKVVYAGVAGNALVAVTKFVAAALTQSSAMLSEAVHSLADTGNQVLMLYGMHRSKRPPDADYPLGHARELYFWSFVVSLLLFALGAGVSLYEGVQHIRSPVEIEHPLVNYVVLGLAALFEGGSWGIAMKEFRARKGDTGYLEAAQESKDPALFVLLAEDSAALLGILIAFAGTGAAQFFDLPELDGMASIAIGILLASVAAFLARESKQLLIGESADPEVNEALCALARQEPGVRHANGILTVHLGPRQIVAALSLDFEESLGAREVQETVARLETRIRRAHPEIVVLMVKPESVEAYRRTRMFRRGRETQRSEATAAERR